MQQQDKQYGTRDETPTFQVPILFINSMSRCSVQYYVAVNSQFISLKPLYTVDFKKQIQTTYFKNIFQ